MLLSDEAHCVKNWGVDFRPEFKKLRSIIPEYVNIMLQQQHLTYDFLFKRFWV